MKSAIFDRFAGLCAMLAGIAIFLYSIAFLVIARSAPETGAWLSALLLLLNGLLATPALTAVYGRLPRNRCPVCAVGVWARSRRCIGGGDPRRLRLGQRNQPANHLAGRSDPRADYLAQPNRPTRSAHVWRGRHRLVGGRLADRARGALWARLAPRAWLWGLSIGDPVAHHLYWALDDPQPGRSAAVGSDPAGRFSGQPHLVYLARSCPVAGSADVK